MHQAIDLVLHLDAHLNDWVTTLGPWLYIVLFAIVFCETGLVVTPFLPGDSLLFAVGAVAGGVQALSLPLVMVLLLAAAILGDAVNYLIGYYIGPRVFKSDQSRFFNKEHLLRTQRFYEKYGGKTIIIARFVPIVRTFAPFVAGIGKMEYHRFALYNVTGAVAWVMSFLLAGYCFGHMPMVKNNFHIVIFGIIIISIMPAVIEYIRSRRQAPVLAPELPAVPAPAAPD